MQMSSPGPALPKRDAAYYQYELKGVVVHSGTAFAGHYYSYIKVRPQHLGGGGGCTSQVGSDMVVMGGEVGHFTKCYQ